MAVSALELKNNSTSATTNSFSQTYQVNPWFTTSLYPLAKHGLLPFYFSKIEITGRENIPATGPVLIAPLHRSRWDGMIVGCAMRNSRSGRNLRFMVSANEMKGFQGWLLKRLGGFPVNTERLEINTFRYSVQLLCNDEMLVIFPEGRIYRDSIVHPLKEGLARIALQVSSQGKDVQILPVGISYSQPYPSWGTDVTIHMVSPINVGDYNSGSSKKRAKELTLHLEERLSNLSPIF